MKIPGIGLIKKAEEKGNEAKIPRTERLGLVDFLKLTFKEVGEDHVSAFAGNVTYKALFAIFPFFTLLLSLLGLFNATNLVTTMIQSAQGALPGTAVTFLEDQILPLTQSQANSAFTFGAIISIALALWGVSGAFRSIMEAMNVMYEVEEGRPAWKQYAMSVFLALGIAALLLSALGLVVFGIPLAESIAGNIPGLGPVFAWVWAIAQWPVLLGIVLFAFALVYYFAPDVEQRFKWISPGSIAAVVLWLLFSLLFSLYVNNFGSYNETYGALAGIAILMLYIYYTSYILLLGAEMNQVIEEHIPEGKNEGEKTTNDGQ